MLCMSCLSLGRAKRGVEVGGGEGGRQCSDTKVCTLFAHQLFGVAFVRAVGMEYIWTLGGEYCHLPFPEFSRGKRCVCGRVGVEVVAVQQ